jgi:surface antigen
MKLSSVVALVAAASLITACQEPSGAPGRGVMQGGMMNKQDVGTIAGAIGGGIIGSNVGGGKGKTTAIIAGSLLGAALGNSIGSSLDRADMMMYHDTSQRALETAQPGQTLPWKNPQTGNSGSVTPKAYYKNAEGDYCREYTQSIVVGGRKQDAYGTACRQPDGSWKIIE